ncbi:HEAT repeat domain-containing protein [Streptomyces sp. EMB24]|uniref:HEAT repeat domain-containing protein n=1 Tax=Streptomyces sp. EMB24 TaxID=2835531 RepID=UPI00227B24A8|nr:HEAT repeat domain-containing protein [Streptomyces sp. EMB24]
MADLDRRPVAGKPSDDWDAFDAKLVSLLSEAIENKIASPVGEEAKPLDNEHAVLLAATRLTDVENRKTALRALVQRWPRSTETRDALVRLAQDEQSEIQLAAIHSLALEWPGDVTARESLINALQNDKQRAQIVAVWGLAEGWAGDVVVRDALASLTLHSSAQVRELAAEGLADGWAGDATARDVLLPLTQDTVQTVRETAVEVLMTEWSGDIAVRDALLNLLQSDVFSVRETAAEALISVWADDTIVENSLHPLLRDPAPTVRWAAERALSRSAYAPAAPRSASVKSAPVVDPKGPRVADFDARLIAVRLPRDFRAEMPLHAISALHRGIGLDSPITIMSGANASGKSILLAALGLRIGCIGQEQRRRMRYLPPLAVELSSRLELLWREQPTPEECLYISNENERHLRDLSIDTARHRLVLIDNWMSSLHVKGRDLELVRLRQYAESGCQFVVVANHENLKLTNERVIQLEGRRMRDQMQFLKNSRGVRDGKAARFGASGNPY